MTGSELGLALSVFLACAVEAVEALTIVLAVGVTRSWRSALTGVGAAVVALAVITAALGPALTALPISVLRVVVGGLLLIFGLQWLRKAILRASGFKALHDEDAIYRAQAAAAREAGGVGSGLDGYSFIISFKGVLLEGLEVWLLVVALGHTLSYPAAAGSAAAALLVVIAVGFALKAPLTRVPENTLKYAVACAILSFGTFWGLGGIVGERAAWPTGDGTLLWLFAAYAGAGRAIAWAARVPSTRGSVEMEA